MDGLRSMAHVKNQNLDKTIISNMGINQNDSAKLLSKIELMESEKLNNKQKTELGFNTVSSASQSKESISKDQEASKDIEKPREISKGMEISINSLRVMGFNNNEDVSLLFRMLISYIVLKVKNKVIQIKWQEKSSIMQYQLH